MRQRRWIGGVAALVVLAGLAGVVVARKSGQPKDDKPKEATLVFTTQEVVQPQSMALPGKVTFSGPLVAPSTVTVRAKAAGTLVSLRVDEGSRVTVGESLGVIDLAELNARLNEKMAQAEAAKALLAQAQRSHNSNLGLAEQKFISPIALENSRASLESAKAQYNAALAQVETARIQLREAALVAPISGIVSKRHALPGEKVAAEQELLTIVDLRKLEMAGSVGTHEVGQLHPGMPVQLQVEGVDTPIEAKLARIAPAAEVGTRSIGVTVTLDNPRELLRAGQFATASVTLPEGAPRLTVPVTALSSSSGQDYVWTLEQGKLLRRTVTTGRRDATRGLVEITDGLAAGSQVLAARFDNLREGQEARIQNATQAASAASGPAKTL